MSTMKWQHALRRELKTSVDLKHVILVNVSEVAWIRRQVLYTSSVVKSVLRKHHHAIYIFSKIPISTNPPPYLKYRLLPLDSAKNDYNPLYSTCRVYKSVMLNY